MSTRSGKPYTKSNSKKNSSPSIVEEEKEDCVICQEDLNDEEKPVTILKNCKHKFHTLCINQWMDSGQPSARECPLCRAHISKNPQNSQLETRVQKVINFEISRGQTPVPFLGIGICINGKMIIKYLNTDLGLGTNNTINDLKTAILDRSDEIAGQRGFLCPGNLRRHLNNAVSLTGATQYRESSFRINRIGFGVPASCDFNFAVSDYNEHASEGILLKDLYSNYEIAAKDVLENRDEYERMSDDVFSNLSDVYYNHRFFIPIGWATTNYFLNKYNPDIPEEFRPNDHHHDEPYIAKATRNSLAWLIVNIECTTFASGITQKRRFKKGNKSVKRRKSIKRRKSNKRKSIKK